MLIEYPGIGGCGYLNDANVFFLDGQWWAVTRGQSPPTYEPLLPAALSALRAEKGSLVDDVEAAMKALIAPPGPVSEIVAILQSIGDAAR